MRKFTVSALLLILVCFVFSTVQAVSNPFWIYGTVTTTPHVSTYNNFTYSVFNFSVSSSNATWLGAPVKMTVAIPTTLLVGMGLVVNQTLNMTGVVSVAGVPSGLFVCEAINQASTVGWLATLKDLITLIAGIGKAVVTLVVLGLGAAFGIVVPAWAVTLAVLAATVASFVFWFKKLPKILLIILFVLSIALIASLIVH